MWHPSGDNDAAPSGNKAASHTDTGAVLTEDDRALIENFVRKEAINSIAMGENFDTRYNKNRKFGFTATLMFDATANGEVYRVCMNVHQQGWGAIWVTNKSRALPELSKESLPFEGDVEESKKETRRSIKAKFTHELHPKMSPMHLQTEEDRKAAITAFRKHHKQTTIFGSPLTE